MTTAISGASRVRLHPLRMRQDDDVWYVGRIDTGEFVELPPIAIPALRLLGEELTADEVAAGLRRDHGRDVNVTSFVANLVGLGYVAAVDGEPVAGPDPIRPTWPWLRPRHAGWSLSPVTATVVSVVPFCALVAIVLSPGLLPTYRDLFWSPHTSVVVLGNALAAWTIIGLHELAHLFTARAAGVPGRIRFGTRLQFLAVQTEVTGIWAAPRRVRMTVYLAGIAVNLTIAGVAVLARAAAGPETRAGGLFAALILIALISVPTQFLLFMRTDLYFVLQDLARCGNLYADGGAYVRYLARRGAHAITGGGPAPADPSAALRPRERRTVRTYAPLLAIGTLICLGFAAAVTLPTGLTVLTRCARGLVTGDAEARVDAVVVAGIAITFWTIWTRAWWDRHGPRVTGWVTRRRTARR